VAEIIFDNTFTKAEALALVGSTEGKVDIVTELVPAEAEKVAQSPFAKVVASHSQTTLIGVFNFRKTDPHWTDIRLRQAVNYALDRERLLTEAAKGYGVIVPVMLPPWSVGSSLDLKPYPLDRAHARGLLKEAGYPDGFPLKIVATAAFQPAAQVIGDLLKEVGFQTEVAILDAQAYKKAFAARLAGAPVPDWDILLHAGFDYSPAYPGQFLFRYMGKGGPYRMVQEDPAFEGMWAELVRTLDQREQQKVVRHMEKYLYDQAYAVFLYSPFKLYAVNRNVNFVPHATAMLILADTSVTADHWSRKGSQ